MIPAGRMMEERADERIDVVTSAFVGLIQMPLQYQKTWKKKEVPALKERRTMQGLIARDETRQLEDTQTELQPMKEYGVRELDVTLIRPTNYTDDGYPIKTRLGVIRSNTLTQIGTLVHDLVNEPFLRGVSLKVRKIDEAIEWIPVKDIVRHSKASGVKSIVMLVGVQSNQYPRALDIASKFRMHDITVLIGGFHVSGMLAMIGVTADLRAAISKGTTLVAGEVEGGRLSVIVEDVLKNRVQPLYDFLNPTPSLLNVPIPHITKDEFENF